MILNITVTPDHFDLISNLIRTVHRFYPVGFELTNEQYYGFAELRNIVDEKIQQIMLDKVPAEIILLKDNIEKMYGELPLYFDVHRNSPSYSVSILIASQEFESLDRSLLLSIKISLLSNYYTVFFEERVKHKSISTPYGPAHVTTVISQEAQNRETEKETASQIKAIIQACLPSYQFVPHNILFTMKLNGVPFGQDQADPKREYLLYDFLFESGLYPNISLCR